MTQCKTEFYLSGFYIHVLAEFEYQLKKWEAAGDVNNKTESELVMLKSRVCKFTTGLHFKLVSSDSCLACL